MNFRTPCVLTVDYTVQYDRPIRLAEMLALHGLSVDVYDSSQRAVYSWGEVVKASSCLLEILEDGVDVSERLHYL